MLVNGDDRITWGEFIHAFAGLVEGPKTVHDHSPEAIRSHWDGLRPRMRDSFGAAFRLAVSPTFHAQLGTIPPVGRLIRGSKELVARRITPEQKAAMKSRLQGRRKAVHATQAPAVDVPHPGRIVREAYRSWVSNDLAKARLGWKPAHSFELGVRRTGDWLRFARMV